jgi:hypothetical protein
VRSAAIDRAIHDAFIDLNGERMANPLAMPRFFASARWQRSEEFQQCLAVDLWRVPSTHYHEAPSTAAPSSPPVAAMSHIPARMEKQKMRS